MKPDHSLLASALLLLGTVGLLAGAGKSLGTRETAREKGRAAAAWMLSAQLGDLVRLETAQPEEPSPSPEPSSEPSPAPSGEPAPVTTVEEAWDEEIRKVEEAASPSPVAVDAAFSLELRNETDYEVDFTALPGLPEGLELDTEDPVILLMHTHGTEGYAEIGGGHTQDEGESVIAVGDRLAETLERRGYHVVHDKTLCDYPEYTGAYTRSRTVIEENLTSHPSIVLVIDLHRDAVEDENGNLLQMSCQLEGGETAAQVMLVVGTDAGGLDNPSWRENLSLAAVLQARLERSYPGLMRPLDLRSERFNQDLAPLDLLVEIGSSGNTLEEALRSAELLGGAIGDLLDQYNGKSS